MDLPPPQESETLLKLKRTVAAPGLLKGAHRFFLSRVGTDLILEVGFIDLGELQYAAATSSESGSPLEANLIVTDRFALSPQGAAHLFLVAQAMLEDLKSAGLIFDPLPESEP
ncbi:MAG: hypothetical protein WAM82_09515 [Thermoanaerobaculia bacterium]